MVMRMSEIPAKGVQNSKTIGGETIVIKTPVQVTIPGDIHPDNSALDRKFGKVPLS